MVATVREDPRDQAAEREVRQVVSANPGKFDFFDVLTMVEEKTTVYRGEAKAALVHMINKGELVEAANRKITVAEER